MRACVRVCVRRCAWLDGVMKAPALLPPCHYYSQAATGVDAQSDATTRWVVLGAKVMIALGAAVLVCTVTMTILCETSYGTPMHDNC